MSKKKIDELDKKIEQLKARKQALIAREKEQERKERTRRLIQIGAIVESRLNLTLEETEKLCDYLHEFPQIFDKVKSYINKELQVNVTIKEFSEHDKKQSPQ